MPRPWYIVEPRQRRSIVGHRRTEMSRRLKLKYEEGRSMRELAEQERITESMVRKLLQEAGTEIRPRGGDQRPGRK
ncbi:helix-turn-helix domain-containing protein [Spirillospora sp. NPDC048911]|uniref:helix-turn-helix domain-containing protein n=1 Tax=Spirillospora sp. NPDC048911 TaxID=3364527 RepID=UPI0037215769